MKNVITYLKTLWRRGLGSQSSDVSLDCRLTVGSPSVKCRLNLLRLVAVVAILLTIGVGNMWGAVLTGDYTSSAPTGWSQSGTQKSGYYQLGTTDNYIQTPAFSVAAYGTITVKIKSYVTGTSKSSTCSLIGLDKDGKAVETKSVTCSSTNMTSSYPTTTWTLTNSSNNIKKVKFVYTKATSSNMRVTEFKVIFPTTVTLDKNGGSANGSVRINHDEKAYVTSTFSAATYDASHTCTGYYTSEAGGTKVLNYDGSFAGSSVTESTTTYISSSQWAYEGETLTLYAHWESAASCSANPSIGDASLNGSFNLTTVGVQCASITPGTNCSVASGDYGFIWYERDGTKKEIGGTDVTKVAVTSGAYSSGSFSANLTKSSFELGTRYSVRAFATNGKPATVYSDTITFQPRSVTFNLNGHGSSTPTTQYVNNGGKATDPSYSESVTGYTFGGWYKEAGCSNSWTFGTDVVSGANKTLYAKWTAKTYTIDLDQDLTPTSAGTTSITATYNSNSNLTSAITPPTKTGWTFAGYYTEKNGSGTQIIDADGNVIASVATYTDASKNWIKAGGVTLYAKWTCTVTWSVNKATNVYSAQTVTYNSSGCKVASVPSGSDLDLENDYCGDKFMGWTSDENYVHGTSNLFTNVAGSPNITGDVTFYAVFADYAD